MVFSKSTKRVLLVTAALIYLNFSPYSNVPSHLIGDARFKDVSNQVLLIAAQKEISTALSVRDTGEAVDAYPYSDDADAWRKVSEKLAGRYGTLQKDYVMTAVEARKNGLMPNSFVEVSVAERRNVWNAPALVLNVKQSNGSCKLLLKGQFTGECKYRSDPGWTCVTGRNMPCIHTEQAYVKFVEVDGVWHIKTIAPYRDLEMEYEFYMEPSSLLDPYSCFTLSRNRLDC